MKSSTEAFAAGAGPDAADAAGVVTDAEAATFEDGMGFAEAATLEDGVGFAEVADVADVAGVRAGIEIAWPFSEFAFGEWRGKARTSTAEVKISKATEDSKHVVKHTIIHSPRSI